MLWSGGSEFFVNQTGDLMMYINDIEDHNKHYLVKQEKRTK